jgi:hypothetical protein
MGDPVQPAPVELVEKVVAPTPADVLPPDPNDTELPHADLDTRSPEAVLRTRGNIVSDGPGTVGY